MSSPRAAPRRRRPGRARARAGRSRRARRPGPARPGGGRRGALTSSTTTRLTARAATTAATPARNIRPRRCRATEASTYAATSRGRHVGVALPPVAGLDELEPGEQPGLGRAALAPVGGPALEPGAQHQVVAPVLDQRGQRRPGREQRLVRGGVDLLVVDLVDHHQPRVDQVVEDLAVPRRVRRRPAPAACAGSRR